MRALQRYCRRLQNKLPRIAVSAASQLFAYKNSSEKIGNAKAIIKIADMAFNASA